MHELGLPTRAVSQNQMMAGCPAHAERTGSLSVRWTSSQQGGMVLLYCHGCQERAPVLAEALGLTMADLYDEPLPERPQADWQRSRAGRSPQQRRNGRRRGRLGRLPRPIARRARNELDDQTAAAEHEWSLVRTYPYESPEQGLVQEVLREQCTHCAVTHKQFRQQFVRADGRRLKRKPAGFEPVLYRQPQLMAAIGQGQTVWLLEGEKDVETAEGLGLVATTNAQGGGSFPPELAELFRGADVAVVLDRDDAGWSRGVALAGLLNPIASRVRIFLPATEDAKSDFTDHVDAGHTLEDLERVHVREVQLWAAVAAARKKHTGVEQALAETQAQLGAAATARAEARAGEASQSAAEHERFARRWAAETEIRLEALREIVGPLADQVFETGTVWAAEALETAEEVLRQARIAARTAHTAVGLPLPPVVQEPQPRGASAASESASPSAATAAAPSTSTTGTAAVAVPSAAEPAGRLGHAAGDSAGHAAGGSADDERATRALVGEIREGVAIDQPTFRIVNGAIVQIERDRKRRRGRDDQDDWEDPEAETLKLILGLDVRIVEMEYLEDEPKMEDEAAALLGRESREDQAKVNPSAPPELSAVVITYTDPDSREPMQLRIPADQWRDCTWLESLPGPPDYDAKPSGLATLRRAVKAVSGPIRSAQRHRWTGWRHGEDGTWRYVHAGGSIGTDGTQPTPVLLSGPLARYDLPDPTQDPATLRAAFLEASGSWLDQMPARVAAPLLGHVYRSAVGPNPWVLALIGSPGSYKTSIASLAMHHWGELWDRRKPASSMSGNGDTLNALRIKLNSAKDALYWADDVAPTRDWQAAQKTLEEFARLVHNSEQRSRSTRDGLSVLAGTPPRASALVTSEVMPRPGSGSQRMLVVPLQAEEIELERLIALDAVQSRHQRALLMASMVQWLSGALEEQRAKVAATAGRYAESLRAIGESVREAEAVAHTWAGWVVMGDFLVDVGALSVEERDQLLARVDQGLRDAVVASHDPDLPANTGARVRELMRHALQTGLAYVDDVRTGDAPPWPLAGRLGWRRVVVATDDFGPKYRMESRGIRFGYVLHDPDPREGFAQLMVESTALEQVLKATAKTMSDAPEMDRGTAIKALHDEGVLVAEQRSGRTPRFTVQRTLQCEGGRRQRMTVLRLDELFGDDRDDEPLPGSAPPDGPPGDAPQNESPDSATDAGETGQPGHGPGDGQPAALDLGWESSGVSGSEGVDGTTVVDVPQHPGLPSTTPPPGLTSLDDAEDLVRIHTDATGVGAPAELVQVAEPCLLCGTKCTVRFLGVPIHLICWQTSTPESRAAASPGSSTSMVAPAPAAAAPRPSQERSATALPTPEPTAEPANSDQSSDQGSGQNSAASVPARAAGGFRAPAAIVDGAGVWLPDGSRVDLPRHVVHVGHLAELVEQLGLGTQVTRRRAEPGQIWVTGTLLAELGIDVGELPEDPARRGDSIKQLTRDAALVTSARAEGWNLGGAGDCLSAWTRVWRGDQRGVWVALIPAMDEQLPILADAPTPATLARRLALFAGALDAPWAMSPATTGLDLMISLRAKDRERLFTPREPVAPATVSTLEQDLNWSRPPTEAEAGLRYVHAYDRGGSYAAGIAGLELGVGDPVHHADGLAFDKKLPGYWRFEVPADADWRMPHPLNPRGSLPAQPVWSTTPTMQLAYELGYEVPILEAYVWPEHGRILDPWYERVRDARTALDVDDVDAQVARDLLKTVYTRSIGMMGSQEWMKGRRGYAPDRRHHIVAKARSNILRRVRQIGTDSGQWPVAVTADTVLYLSDEVDPIAAWPGRPEQLGRGFGQFKHEASGLLVDQLPHLQGRGYRGKDDLVDAWETSDSNGQPGDDPADSEHGADGATGRRAG